MRRGIMTNEKKEKKEFCVRFTGSPFSVGSELAEQQLRRKHR